ncbi:MAG: SUMF1/EgtB/PvdO family nonheme iron enzyme [Anaerolineae bacterium]|nr:SUMF1/EgtB/PvdO family nonheme iron enzyme [Anaerolineae bacterium]
MPTLFISYKRGTTAVAPLMDKLKAAKYRLWFDRDEIHLGDPDWQARIDQGIQHSDGVILNITPAACASEPVRYEVRKALELGKPIFPIMLERIADYDAAIRDLGLPEKQHIEDFTEVTRWNEQVERLLRDLRAQGLRVTRHDLRQERGEAAYTLHQAYLKRLVDKIGMLSLAQITTEGTRGIPLEQVYVDSPVPLSISLEMKDWQIVDWWIPVERRIQDDLKINDDWKIGAPARQRPEDFGYEHAPLETLLNWATEAIAAYRRENPDARSSESAWRSWHDGVKENRIALHVQDIAAACDRLVVLGAPGSGKSTFVRYLALCLAGSQIAGWDRPATLDQLGIWPHGALTPVYVELRRFVASAYFPQDVNTQPTADHLWHYIEAELLGDDLKAYAPDLQHDLQEGHAVLILDGLDEVPYPEGQLDKRQRQLQSLATSLNIRWQASRVIVASRPYAYQGWSLPGFQTVTLADFKDPHRIELATRLYQVAGLSEEDAQQKAQALNQQLSSIDPELKDRPLFLTLMATIYLKGDSEGLPTRKGALYRESILLLLDRWTASKPGAPSLVEILGDQSLDDLYDRLAALAYAVHSDYGEQAGTPEIDESLLYKHLKPLGRATAVELIPYLSENAGVLVSPGQNKQQDVFHFAHRTFQEYLSAVQIISHCLEADDFTLVRDLIQRKPQTWREPCQLAADVLVDEGRLSDLWDLLDDLLEDELPDQIAADDARWWRVWLAGRIVEAQALYKSTKLRKGEQAVRDDLIAWLVRLVQTPQALEPVERADCGRTLGLLGDPRPGIGVVVHDGLNLPDIDWVTIPGGEFQYGHEYEYANPPQVLTLLAFEIARYPITYVQFQCFVDALDFDKDEWWAGVPEETEAYGRTYRTREMSEQKFKYSNHPREGVSWYQAMAFCRWLSDKLGCEVTLPTEQQWERAARGPDGRPYPYGSEFDAAKGNTDETGSGGTSAVGIFPDGASPEGVLDLSGNVQEWCLNKYYPSDETGVDASGDNRVSRGGSWFNSQAGVSTVYRSGGYPVNRINEVGFRVVRPK